MSAPARPARWALWLPLAVLAGLIGLFVVGLYRPASRDIESGMVGKPLPEFALPAAAAELPGLSRADMADGRPKLLNIFASWCVPCAAEAGTLMQLKQAGVPVVGIAIRDKREDLEGFLARNGNPYARIGADDIAAVQIAMGSSGVPESFVIDGKGVIRYQHIGVIMPNQVPMILDKLREAGR